MFSQPASFVSEAEYLEHERKAEFKSEYFDGEVFAMVGASPWHGWIVANLVIELGYRLIDGPFRVSASDVRLRVSRTGLYTYPDVMVVCAEPQFADDQKDTLLNPVLLVEVLSKSTRDYDRGLKFEHYRTLPSLKEYLTIAQNAPHVEHWVRQPENHWLLTEYRGIAETLQLPSLGCALPLASVYRKIDWAAEPSDESPRTAD
jgi:Uma2 family endonuclease